MLQTNQSGESSNSHMPVLRRSNLSPTSNMSQSKTSQLYVELDNSELGCYHPGDKVKGRVIVQNSEPLPVASLTTVFRGFATSEYVTLSTGVRDDFSDSDILFSESTNHIKQNQTQTLPPCTRDEVHEFPFTFIFPVTVNPAVYQNKTLKEVSRTVEHPLPPTFSETDGHAGGDPTRHTASVRYEIKAKLTLKQASRWRPAKALRAVIPLVLRSSPHSESSQPAMQSMHLRFTPINSQRNSRLSKGLKRLSRSAAKSPELQRSIQWIDMDLSMPRTLVSGAPLPMSISVGNVSDTAAPKLQTLQLKMRSQTSLAIRSRRVDWTGAEREVDLDGRNCSLIEGDVDIQRTLGLHVPELESTFSIPRMSRRVGVQGELIVESLGELWSADFSIKEVEIVADEDVESLVQRVQEIKV
jgi:Arrestin (or S-antigen), N-terminal domain